MKESVRDNLQIIKLFSSNVKSNKVSMGKHIGQVKEHLLSILHLADLMIEGVLIYVSIITVILIEGIRKFLLVYVIF